MKNHCQICGREIKAVVGRDEGSTRIGAPSRTHTIAHHGYRRPWGQGWQTSSCFGAKWRPYEAACDALPPYISMLEGFAETQATALRRIWAEPPVTLTYQRNQGPWKPASSVEVPRPEGFSPDAPTNYIPGSYVTLYRAEVSSHESHLRSAAQELKRAWGRLQDWRAPPPG